MKLTREIKEYAIQEFKARVRAVEQAARDAIEVQREPYQQAADALCKDFDTAVQTFKRNLPKGVRVSFNTPTYYRGDIERPTVSASVSMDYPYPETEKDLVKFLAELSMGSDLNEMSALLAKYFPEV